MIYIGIAMGTRNLKHVHLFGAPIGLHGILKGRPVPEFMLHGGWLSYENWLVKKSAVKTDL